MGLLDLLFGGAFAFKVLADAFEGRLAFASCALGLRGKVSGGGVACTALFGLTGRLNGGADRWQF